MFACVLAAFGGVLMSSISSINNGLIQTGLLAFSVVILGGLDSFLGAMIAGPIIGLAENHRQRIPHVIYLAGPQGSDSFIIIIIVMFIRPTGCSGKAG